jgi:hypothetical protein
LLSSPCLFWNTAREVPWFLCQTYVGVIGWIDGFLQGRYFFPLTPPLFLIAITIARKLPHPAPSPQRDKILNLAAISAFLLYVVCSRFYG